MPLSPDDVGRLIEAAGRIARLATEMVDLVNSAAGVHPAAAALRADGCERSAALVQAIHDRGGSAAADELVRTLGLGSDGTLRTLVNRTRTRMALIRQPWSVVAAGHGWYALRTRPATPRPAR